MLDGPPGARAPRPVADVPPPALANGAAVAKAWLLELLAAAPLEAAGAVPVAELAARGPALGAAFLGAVGTEAGLERLRPGGAAAALASGAAALAGARDPAAAAAAVAALRRAAWTALRRELRDLDAAATAALSERVVHVADVVTAAVLAPARAEAAGGPAVVADRAAGGARAEAADRAPDVGADLAGAEAPWRDAIERRLAMPAGGSAPLAVLAVEAADAERLVAAGGADATALEALETAVRGAVRSGDAVVRERAGRLWVVAPGLDGVGARAFGAALAEATAAAAAPHGAPLQAAIGVAVAPDDGTDAGALAGRADERLFAARAAGVPVV